MKNSFLTFLFLGFFLSENAPFAQEWKQQETMLITNVSVYRSHLMRKDKEGTFALKALIDKWHNLESDPEKIKKFAFYAQYYSKVQKFKYPTYLEKYKENLGVDTLINSITESEYEVIKNHSSLLDLINAHLLKIEYPYKIDPKSNLFREFEFYGFEEGDQIGEVGAGNGTFSLLLTFLLEDCKVYFNEYNFEKYVYFERKLRGDPILSGVKEKIDFKWGKRKKTNFKKNSLDKVIIRNSFHHFSHKEDMLRDIKRVLKKEGELFILEYPRELGSCRTLMEPDELKNIVTKNEFELTDEIKIGKYYLTKYAPVRQN